MSEPEETDDLTLFGEEIEEAGEEADSDLEELSELDFAETSLAPTDWTVETILSQLKETALDLDPAFQRRDAWTNQRKSKFVESLMLGLPVPQLVLAEGDPDEGTYVVIDGKQRLLTLEKFFDPKAGFKLTALTALKNLNGMTREEIESDPVLKKYIRRLKNRTIRTVVIRKWPNDSFLHLVFHRLNHQTLPLSAQELRQALSPGKFATYVDRYAAKSEHINASLGIKGADFRMRDVELLVRYLGFHFRIEDYAGNLKRFLDETCDIFNKDWKNREEEVAEACKSCDEAIVATNAVFGENAFRRYDNGRYESRFNRAVFDVMTYYFSNPAVASRAIERSGDVVRAFEDLSSADASFASSLKSTTKTIDATNTRFSKWGDALAGALSMELRVPRLVGRRMRIS
ncbi:GmrSD restriction endonuclease domain-containing protein [Streptomyces sp. NPDC003863]